MSAQGDDGMHFSRNPCLRAVFPCFKSSQGISGEQRRWFRFFTIIGATAWRS